MIIHDCAQGSPEWTQLRLGIPTASCFSKIVTPKGALSKSSAKYMHQLIAERLTGDPFDVELGGDLVMRGKHQEKSARAYYALKRDVEVTQVGFVTTDDGAAGASPDFLVGVRNGGGEIKIPGLEGHIGHLLGDDHNYHVQIQGNIWVCEAEWWDWVCFNDILAPAIVREKRDEEFITKLAAAVGVFCERLDQAVRRIRKGE